MLERITIEVIGMKDKLKLFMKKNGYLTMLFLLVCVVAGATLYIATRDLGTGSKDLEIVKEEKVVDKPNEEEITDVHLEREIFNSGQDIARGETEEAEETEVAAEVEEEPEVVEEEEEIEFIDSAPPAAEPVTEKMMMPVEGEIITGYVNDSLIYSETLDEWRTHLGIDIKAPLREKVKAPLGGVIKSVYEDELWGKVIVIDHGNGLESKLANLGTLEMVKEGLEVLKGDHIGTVGKTANIESKMEDHLHFELIKDGKNIDPRSIIH